MSVDETIRASLERLVEPVEDPEAVVAEVERRRARQRRRHTGVRLLGAAATVAVMGVAALVAGIAGSDSDSESVTAGQPDDDGQPATTASVDDSRRSTPFELVTVLKASDPPGTLRAAVNPEEAVALWREIGAPSTPPDIDFGSWVLVSVTITDDACPPDLRGFVEDDEALLTPMFVEPFESCAQPRIPRTFVATLDRAAVSPRFTLRLPGHLTDGFGEQRHTTEVPATNTDAPGQIMGPRFRPTDFEVGWTDEQNNPLPDGLGEPNAPLIINTIRGPEHCDWESAVVMHLAVPLGVESYDFGTTHVYVRDPNEILPSQGTGSFVEAVGDLPEDARFSGFRNGDIELWLAPSTFDEVVYVGRGGRFEAWPREVGGVACR